MKNAPRLLLITDDRPESSMLAAELREHHRDSFVDIVHTADALERAIGGEAPDLVLLSFDLTWTSPTELLGRVVASWPLHPVVVCAQNGSEELAVEALKAGAVDYVALSSGSSRFDRAVCEALALPRVDRQTELRQLRLKAMRLENDVTSLQQGQNRLIAEERMKALTEMAGGISHDFNNALCIIQGFVELLLLRPVSQQDSERVDHYLNMIHNTTLETAQVVRRLRDFYRQRNTTQLQTVLGLDRLVNSVLKDRAEALRRQGIDVVTNLPDKLYVRGCWEELLDAVGMLIDNASEAMADGGSIRIETSVDGDEVILAFSDTGCGMSESEIGRCIEPFFTTKGAGRKGLGLSTVHGTAMRHGGALRIESSKQQGTRVLLRLPLCHHSLSFDSERLRESWRASHSCSILVAEDAESVREILAEMLVAQGHHVAACGSSKEALERFTSQQFDVVICDRDLSGMGGEALAARLRQLRPDQPIILLTGLASVMQAEGKWPANVDVVVSKPIDFAKLEICLAELTEHRHELPIALYV